MARLMALVETSGVTPRRDLLPAAESLRAAFALLEAGPATAALLAAEVPPSRAWRVQRALAWLLKLDLVRLAPEG